MSQRLHIPAPVYRCLGILQSMSLHRYYLEPGSHNIMYEERQSIAISKYWRNTVPSASWESLACVLYSLRENAALQRVKEFLTKVRGVD